MKIFKAGISPKKKGSLDYFHGNVMQQNLMVEADLPARVQVLKVSFEAEARTAWHTHPLGQTLLITSGVGLIGLRKKVPQIISQGDTVWIPPNEEHWHGATKDSYMEHIAIQESLDGKVADWLEKVLDDDYSI